jgi:hypothetical protein
MNLSLDWLPQVIVSVIALGGLGWFFQKKFGDFDSRLDKFESKIDGMRDSAADTKEQTAVRLAKFDEHSRFLEMSRQENERLKEKTWELNAKVSKIFSILDNRSISDGIHKDK